MYGWTVVQNCMCIVSPNDIILQAVIVYLSLKHVKASDDTEWSDSRRVDCTVHSLHGAGIWISIAVWFLCSQSVVCCACWMDEG